MYFKLKHEVFLKKAKNKQNNCENSLKLREKRGKNVAVKRNCSFFAKNFLIRNDIFIIYNSYL